MWGSKTLCSHVIIFSYECNLIYGLGICVFQWEAITIKHIVVPVPSRCLQDNIQNDWSHYLSSCFQKGEKVLVTPTELSTCTWIPFTLPSGGLCTFSSLLSFLHYHSLPLYWYHPHPCQNLLQFWLPVLKNSFFYTIVALFLAQTCFSSSKPFTK